MKNHISTGAALHADHYRPDIDGLRAIAVMSVVIGHAFPHLLPGGFVGVDIFFVISGYLITSILLRDIDGGQFSLLHFYDRRIRRIFPALVTVLVCVLGVGWFVLFRPEFTSLGAHVVASSAFSENLLLWSETGYFDVEAIFKPTLHLWSLAIEEQFYIVWPLVLALSARLRLNRLATILVLAGLSFAINQWDVFRNPDAAYYAPYGRAWELLAGGLLAHFRTGKPRLAGRFAYWQSLLGFTLIALSILLVQPRSHFPGITALAPVIGAALIIAAGPASSFNRDTLSSAPMVWIGLISYPLYLWHWPILSFAYILFDDPPPAGRAVVVILSLIAAWLTFQLVERPIRKPRANRRIPAALLASLVIVACVGGIAARGLIVPRLPNYHLPEQTEWDFLKSRTPDFDKNGVGIYRFGGERASKVLFIGDSHVAQYAQRIDQLLDADKNRPSVVMAVGGGCIPIEGIIMLKPVSKLCPSLATDADRLAQTGAFRTIVVGGAWNWYFNTGDYAVDIQGDLAPLNSAEGMHVALQKLEERLSTLKAAGWNVILLLDNPYSDGNDPRLMINRVLADPNVGFAANRINPIDPRELAVESDMKAMAARLGIRSISPREAICDSSGCAVTDSVGHPIFRDPGHFDPEWTLKNAAFIDATVSADATN